MANKTLIELPELVFPSTGTKTYSVESAQSYQASIASFANFIIQNYEILTKTLPADLMTSGNAEVILQGLNNASVAKLNAERLNINFDDFVSGYYDVDGGTFYDTYIDISTFDGGGF